MEGGEVCVVGGAELLGVAFHKLQNSVIPCTPHDLTVLNNHLLQTHCFLN